MRWIKCSERMPPNDDEVLVWCDLGIGFGWGVRVGCWWPARGSLDAWWGGCDEWAQYDTTTHWQPLPEPPHE